MTLPADSLAQLRTGLAPMQSSITWAAKTAGVFAASATTVAVVIVDDVTTQERDDVSGTRQAVRRLTVQLLETAAGRLGDRVTYSAVDFTLEAISNLDVPTWVAVYRSDLGGQRRDVFRAAGGGK